MRERKSTLEAMALLDPADQRVNDRRPIAIRVRLQAPGLRPQTFVTQDLGPRGMFVCTDQPFAVGTRVRLAFSLSAADSFALQAEVTWNTVQRPVGDKQGMGLHFLRLGATDAGRLRAHFGVGRAASRRVVVIEDDRLLRRQLAHAFEKEGFTVVAAPWGLADGVLGAAHVLTVVGADRAGLAPLVARLRRNARTPLVAVVGAGAGSEWFDGDAQFCFRKPANAERVAKIALSLVR